MPKVVKTHLVKNKFVHKKKDEKFLETKQNNATQQKIRRLQIIGEFLLF